MEGKITVNMLGGFSISKDGRVIDDDHNRSRKIWLLLAYMIFRRNEHCSQEQYISLFQAKDSDGDPAGTLKSMTFRARTLLDKLGEGVGRLLLLHRDGSYGWNTQLPLTLDAEEFERLYREGRETQDGDRRLELYLSALKLYRGDFLPKLSSEGWVIPINAYYHRLYLETADEALVLLGDRDRWDEASAICEQALVIEPYSEEFFCHKMRCRLALGDRIGAVRTYEEMSELLFDAFGVMPGDESRRLYRLAASAANNPTMEFSELREQLREVGATKTAIFCEYEFFRLLYQFQARAIARSGDTIHMALFSLHSKDGKELSRRSLERAMDNLKEQLLTNLRQGDVVTQCSTTQYITLLSQANYENSCQVCKRLLRSFSRQYPHSPVNVHYSVHPLEPADLG